MKREDLGLSRLFENLDKMHAREIAKKSANEPNSPAL